ncbi:heavy metal translocating P-type ATPase [Amnibacterium endophyticum]|uniref:Heavy metal translocating P-type ATPase n=1 Tax=Amnibacterium endophyticum TaxID=2109337 RepID=A0ABW4LIH2_9MICO
MSAATDTRSVQLDITGMTCAACANRVERRLNRLPGATASVNLATETATVTGGPALEQLIRTVEAAGYGARPAAPRLREERDARRLVPRLVLAAVLALPTVLLTMLPALRGPASGWVALALAAPVVLWCAWPFHQGAVLAARHRSASMDTLISLGVTAASVASVAGVARGAVHDAYLEVAVVVPVLVLAGKVAERVARRRSGRALRALLQLNATQAVVLRDGREVLVAPTALAPGDRVVVRPGMTVPADGAVAEGRAAVDTALLTGEAVPVEVGPGDAVIGGSLVAGGSLLVTVERVGADTEVARLGRLVAQAQAGKAQAQRLADRVSAVFVPVVLGLALLALAGWSLVGDPGAGLGAAIATLVIACPCAPGLATPTALLVGTGRGAQLGVLIRGPEVLERLRRVDAIVLDKTGTLTTGRMTLEAVIPLAGHDEAVVRRLAAAAEQGSEHPVGRAIAGAGAGAAEEFRAAPGGGVAARVEGRHVLIGAPAWLAGEGVDAAPALPAVQEAEARGATAVVAAIDGEAAGVLVVADALRPEAAAAVAALVALGVEPVLATEDASGPAGAVAAATGIARVHARSTPQGKLDLVRALQTEGRVVAVAGDGVNDAAALAAAGLGIAMGGGTDAAAEAAGVVLLREDPLLVPEAVRLSRRTLRTIRVNLFWAFAYNAAALPVAMLGLLSPVIASGAMALSSVLVVGNSLRLARFRRAA